MFDDSTGVVSIEQSDMVTKRFYEFELMGLLRDNMSLKKRPRLSRQGLEHTTMSVKAALHELKMRANEEDRKSLHTRIGLAFAGFVAVLFGAFQYVRRRGGGDKGSSRG